VQKYSYLNDVKTITIMLEEMNTMENNTDRCKKLRRLHNRLVEELRLLKESQEEEESEGVENPIQTANIIKSLQETLSMVVRELEKCPDEV
jgi:hypothetical protein